MIARVLISVLLMLAFASGVVSHTSAMVAISPERICVMLI